MKAPPLGPLLFAFLSPIGCSARGGRGNGCPGLWRHLCGNFDGGREAEEGTKIVEEVHTACGEKTAITVSNAGTNGFVVGDGLLPGLLPMRTD